MSLYNLTFARHSKGITLLESNGNWIGGYEVQEQESLRRQKKALIER